MSKEIKLDLPKPEFIIGEIDYPEMIKQDFNKALKIVGLSGLTAILATAAVWVLVFFL